MTELQLAGQRVTKAYLWHRMMLHLIRRTTLHDWEAIVVLRNRCLGVQ